MEIVKAEVLWTRKCSMGCSYCGMATGKRNALNLYQWMRGIENLKALGCEFIAFYGAEPFEDFDLLPAVVGYAEGSGIHTTVITSGIDPKTKEKMAALHRHGAKSITMSCDPLPVDISTDYKSKRALYFIKEWKKYTHIRDAALVSTLTKNNYEKFFTDHVPSMHDEGIWCLFDIIHPDHGQPGSKCKNYPKIGSLLFDEYHAKRMIEFAYYAKAHYIKFLHTSEHFISQCNEDPRILTHYTWHCAKSDCFPSWITIDCDGTVHGCDDYQSSRYGNLFIYDENFLEKFDPFFRDVKKAALNECPGCAWNTHIDAHAIKQGYIPVKNYVHT